MFLFLQFAVAQPRLGMLKVKLKFQSDHDNNAPGCQNLPDVAVAGIVVALVVAVVLLLQLPLLLLLLLPLTGPPYHTLVPGLRSCWSPSGRLEVGV